MHRRGWFVSLVVLPWILAPLVILVGRRRARYRRDHGLARARRARARARKRLRVARKGIEQRDSGEFHESVARAVVEYLADRFGRSASGLTYDLAEELLAGRGVDADLSRDVRTCLETCDFARYVESSGETYLRSAPLSASSCRRRLPSSLKPIKIGWPRATINRIGLTRCLSMARPTTSWAKAATA